MSGPYAQAAGDYWSAGWRSVLPLPPGKKASPPDDYTGHKGTKVPSWPDVMAWIEDRPNGNVALRLPRGVIGLDVDDYGTKPGAATLRAKEQQWGELPATWQSTSRDGISGIRLFRVPQLPGGVELRWPGSFGPGTETIHYGHRYCVVAPSIHPDTGKPYRWITPDGVVSMTPPRITDLPELPWAWVKGLTEGREAHTWQGAGMDDAEIRAWLDNHNHGEPCHPMAEAVDDVLEDMADGAHESLRLLMRIVGLAAMGHDGLYAGLAQVREAFLAVAGPRRGGRDVAGEEWKRSLFGAVDKIVGEMTKTSTTGSRIDPCGVVEEVLVSPAPEATTAPDDILSQPTPGSGGDATGDEPDDDSLDKPRELTDEEAAELASLEAKARHERDVERRYQELSALDEAKRRLAAEQAPGLRRLSAKQFREAPRPEALVPAVFYKDSLARVYGAPGCGKSFLAMDLAMHVALGREWRGSQVQRGRVFYVMAEGQAVNVLRAEAWCERNDVDFDDLDGWFDAFPDALSLTESAIREFVEECRRDQPVMVILDTKNAMMVGEENSASDFAVMRRALDAVRKVCGACVVLIDHTGYEGTRARGTSAATAGMDTELFVEKNDDRPAMVTAKVTRDKAAEIGSMWAWHLRMAGEAAALVPIEGYVEGDEDRRVDDGPEAWRDALIPTEIINVEGSGKKSLPDLARLMAYDANQRAGDPAGVGMTRQEAFKVLEAFGHDKPTVRRAWSRLIDMGYLEPAEGVKAAHLRHLWAY